MIGKEFDDQVRGMCLQGDFIMDTRGVDLKGDVVLKDLVLEESERGADSRVRSHEVGDEDTEQAL